RASVKDLDVYVCLGADCEAFEKVVHELGLEVADAGGRYLKRNDGVRPAPQVDGGDRQRFVHRHDEVPGAVDAAPVSERFRDGLAERDAKIFDGMVLIDVEIAHGVDGEIECPVPREELQHVIEEPDAGPHLIASLAVESESEGDLRLGRTTLDQRAAHRTSSMTSMQRRV